MHHSLKPRPVLSALLAASIVAVAALSGGVDSAAAQAGAKPKATRVAVYPEGAQLTAMGHRVALAVANGDHATLMLGTDTTAPTPGPLPVWAQPHLGTEASQKRPVVTYPRCSSAAVSSCDLYVYDILERTESKLGVSNDPARGEIEGVYERGALVLTRWKGKRVPSRVVGNEISSNSATDETDLYERSFGGKVRLVTHHGGRQISLHNGVVAQVRETDASDGVCGTSAVELVSTAGKPTRTVRETTCGLDGTTQVGVDWVGKQLFFAVAGLDGTQYGVYRHDYAGRRTWRATGTIRFRAWTQATSSTAYALRATKVAGARDETDTLPPLELVRVTGVSTPAAVPSQR